MKRLFKRRQNKAKSLSVLGNTEKIPTVKNVPIQTNERKQRKQEFHVISEELRGSPVQPVRPHAEKSFCMPRQLTQIDSHMYCDQSIILCGWKWFYTLLPQSPA